MAGFKGFFGRQGRDERDNRFGLAPEAHLESQREKTRVQGEPGPPSPVFLEPKPLPAGASVLGLRVDVDTYEGLRDGVPRLLDAFAREDIKATFYVAMGPDHSGKAIFNILTRPGFLAKMLRSGAPKIYSARTMLSGTLLPARRIGTGLPEVVRRVDAEGHETGVHAWNHRAWQDGLPKFTDDRIVLELERGADAYAEILNKKPLTYAAPAWLCCDDSLLHQDKIGLLYASDCRGTDPFFPVIVGRPLTTPQVPATLPTLDECLGLTEKTAQSYFARMLSEVKPGEWPVLTVHAELEGGPFIGDFVAFLRQAKDKGVHLLPLRDVLAARMAGPPLPRCTMAYGAVEGRHGAVSIQMLEV